METSKPARDPRVPEPYGTVCPWIISRDTGKVIEFASEAFGAKEIARVTNEDGSIGHAEFFIGELVVLAFDARPQWPETPAFLRIYVADADATFDRAVRAGGEAGHDPGEHALGRPGRPDPRPSRQPVVGHGSDGTGRRGRARASLGDA